MITGIICEFNPFHAGHKHLIDSVKGDGGVICAMSGNFVQRGDFAVYDKFTRARTAVKNGADLVIELPSYCAVQSAEGFARAGVKLLEATGTVNQIAFGTENDDIKPLMELAQACAQRKSEIVEEMKTGISFPAARSRVLNSDLLKTPNNILAVEYLKFTSLPCVAVKRIGGGHDSDDPEYSASQIRKNMNRDEICLLERCDTAVLAKLRSISRDDLALIPDVTEGLENRIIKALKYASGTEELYSLIKTKRYTHSRIRRIVLRAFLGLDESFPNQAPYIRILAFNEKGVKILSEMKKNASLPVIARYADAKKLKPNERRLFEYECKCTDIYNLGFKAPKPCGTEQEARLEII